tara:strand:- start:120 stop:512 length:393 start_codon:yes stop_codon:yes gene_type:complete
MITLEEGVQLVWDAFEDMVGGEIYVKKIKSMRIVDIALAIDPKIKHVIVGTRPGEKLHEQMIGIEDSPFTYEFNDYYKILPSINNWSKDPKRINSGKLVSDGFVYSSETNSEKMSIETLQNWIKKYKQKL